MLIAHKTYVLRWRICPKLDLALDISENIFDLGGNSIDIL